MRLAPLLLIAKLLHQSNIVERKESILFVLQTLTVMRTALNGNLNDFNWIPQPKNSIRFVFSLPPKLAHGMVFQRANWIKILALEIQIE